MLSKLVAEHDADPGFPRSTVVSLMAPGTVGRQMLANGVRVESLNLRQVWQLPAALALLTRIVREQDPDIIQGWMYHGNVAATAAARMVPRCGALLWNIRHSLGDPGVEKLSSEMVIRLGALLSKTPRATIYNSMAAVRQHVARGYNPRGAVVIPNGFDDQRFRPDAPQRRSRANLCESFNIDRSPILLAIVARHHPMKDHATAIEAVGKARAMGHDIHLLLAGNGTDALPAKLMAACRRWLPANRLTLLGDRRDVAEWLPGCDIIALSSAWGEGFPNILGEAMASGVPCIATDVGDSKLIIADGGICVPKADPAAMAKAIANLCAIGPEGRQLIGFRGRSRVQAEYSLPVVARRYADLYETTLRTPLADRSTGRDAPQCAG